MKDRLFILFWEDRSSRVKMYAFSVAVALLVGVISDSGNGHKADVIGNIIATSLISLLGWTFAYSFVGWSRRSTGFTKTQVGRRAALAGGLLSIAVTGGLSTQHLEAAVINRRLRDQSQREVTKSGLHDISTTLQYIQDTGLRVDRTALASVGRTLLKVSDTNAPPEITEAIHSTIESVAGAQSFVGFPLVIEGAVSAPLTFARNSRFVENVFLDAPIVIDTNIFYACDFTQCTIIYGGEGPIDVRWCQFTRCKFQIKPDRRGLEFLSRLIESNFVSVGA